MEGIDIALRVADLIFGYLESRGLVIAELQTRRAQRIAEGHEGLIAEDMAEFRQRAQAAVDRIPD